MRQFRATEAGDYLLFLVDSFEEALNDDWLPKQICGMSLAQAEKFSAEVATASGPDDADALAITLKEIHRAAVIATWAQT